MSRHPQPTACLSAPPLESNATHCGWVDERGILFPLSAYNPERASQYDAHKAGWEKVYTLAAPVPEQNYAKCYVCDGPMDGKSEDDCHCFHRKELSPLPPTALAEARAFGAGLDAASLEQPSEVV